MSLIQKNLQKINWDEGLTFIHFLSSWISADLFFFMLATCYRKYFYMAL